MAVLKTYKCKKCGYEVLTELQGHYGLANGEYYNFRCVQCRNIVNISAQDLAQQCFTPACPTCGAVNLYTWNPEDGKCPKCGGRMWEDDEALMICAD